MTDAVVADLLRAVDAGDWTTVRALLHPYLHWSDAAGTLRGRTNVLAHLRVAPPVAPPASCELRDGQVYRWTAGVPD